MYFRYPPALLLVEPIRPTPKPGGEKPNQHNRSRSEEMYQNGVSAGIYSDASSYHVRVRLREEGVEPRRKRGEYLRAKQPALFKFVTGDHDKFPVLIRLLSSSDFMAAISVSALRRSRQPPRPSSK